MVAVEVIMEMTGLDKNSVRRIGRNIGATQYKDAKVEMYDTDDDKLMVYKDSSWVETQEVLGQLDGGSW